MPWVQGLKVHDPLRVLDITQERIQTLARREFKVEVSLLVEQ